MLVFLALMSISVVRYRSILEGLFSAFVQNFS